jgi:hypothetical protein
MASAAFSALMSMEKTWNEVSLRRCHMPSLARRIKVDRVTQVRRTLRPFQGIS